MQEVKSLYALKALCAFAVVFIHVPSLWREYELVAPFIRTAVPIFFMMNGYFLFNDNTFNIIRVKKTIIKITKITLVATIVYLLFYIIERVFMDETPIPSQWLKYEFWIRWFLVGDNINYPFWYLTSLIQALALLGIFILIQSKIQSWINSDIIKCILFVSVPFFLVAILLNRYSFLLTKEILPSYYSKNVFFAAIPCISSGICLRFFKTRINELNKSKILFVLFFIIVLAYTEILLLHIFDKSGSGSDFQIMTLPLAIIIFIICLRKPKLPNNILQWMLVSIGKHHATNIYLYHILAYLLLQLSNLTYLCNAECAIILSLLISLLIFSIKPLHKIGSKSNLKW